MSNKEITSYFRLALSLLQLHDLDESRQKIYNSAVFQLERLEQPLESLDEPQIRKLGFTQNISQKIAELLHTGSFMELQELLDRTPKGVLDMMDIKGLGAKKVQTLWKENNISSLAQLKEACLAGNIAKVKGFGEKTQTSILQEIEFKKANESKKRYDQAEPFAEWIATNLEQRFGKAELIGAFRRRLEIIEQVDVLVEAENPIEVHHFLNGLEEIETDQAACSPFVWRGFFVDNALPLEIRISKPANFASQAFIYSAAPAHMNQVVKNHTLLHFARNTVFENEKIFYQKLGLPYIVPEQREGVFEFENLHSDEQLIDIQDIKGIVHAHSTYSDGRHSLAEMAQACQNKGYEYLVISDHSQTAFYAKGLTVDRIRQQHTEIEALNAELKPFKILKSIESDILTDGSLDYTDDVLASFDMVIASVHSVLKMDKSKATERLIRAIANPYTTVLGHPTGRLLLKREGYPIDYEAVIDACAEFQVAIEINASPQRLDLDWRWIRKAIGKGVLLSVNPDAHSIKGLEDVKYGIFAARKGGLPTNKCLNALSLNDLENYLRKRKEIRMAIM